MNAARLSAVLVILVVIVPVVRGVAGSVVAVGAVPRVGGGRLSGVPSRVGLAGLHAGAIIVPPVLLLRRVGGRRCGVTRVVRVVNLLVGRRRDGGVLGRLLRHLPRRR